MEERVEDLYSKKRVFHLRKASYVFCKRFSTVFIFYVIVCGHKVLGGNNRLILSDDRISFHMNSTAHFYFSRFC